MIYEAIQFLFPGITGEQFMLQDDGTGPYIAFWNRPEPQPSMTDIEAMYPMVQSAMLQTQVVSAVQSRLDDFARTKGYDGILSACTYATSAVPSFKAEGQYAVNSRDSYWATCYQILGAVQQGLRALPSLEEVIAELPPLQWPD